MKVCGKKDIHVPGCDDCQELEERVEAVEECCNDAHEEIDTLNADKADKEYVDDSIDNVNQTIVDVADTLGERIDNIITASEPSVTTLWEGVMESIGDSANLSEDVNDFDYLDIYYRTSVDESEGYYNTVRIPADQFANYTITVGGTLSPLGESPNLSQYLTQLSFVDDTATIDNIREWSWNGSQSSDASDDMQAATGVTIYRIDGVKETGGSLEIADAREGVDGTVYPSLGDAIRGQIEDTRDMIPDQYVRDVEVNGESVVDANAVAHIEIPEMTDTVTGNPIVVEDAQGKVKSLKVDIEPEQDGTPWQASELETAPYTYRKSPDMGHTYNSEYDKIVGGTVAWNQMIQNGDFQDDTGWVAQNASSSLSVANNVATVTVNDGDISAYNPALRLPNISLKTGHRYLISLGFWCDKQDAIMYMRTNGVSSGSVQVRLPQAGQFNNITVIETGTDWDGQPYIGIANANTVGIAIGDSIKFRNIMIIDLTQMFGSTIADYIYSLEQANAGAGVAWFKKLFPKDYYEYNAGQLMSVKTSAHQMVGFNQWDEQYQMGYYDDDKTFHPANGIIAPKNIIPIFPNTTYCMYYDNTKYSAGMHIVFYDASGEYISAINQGASSSVHIFTTPARAYGLLFYTFQVSAVTGYNNDICLNLSWDGERDGEYEAYKKWTYPLDSDLELRGIPKLDASNNLYYDGDSYKSSGDVTRKYGIVDLGILTYSYDNTYGAFRSVGGISDSKPHSSSTLGNAIMANYTQVPNMAASRENMTFTLNSGAHAANTLYVKNTAYTDAATFKTAMSGVYLVYELATPTTEEADPYQNPQIVDDFGTEEYVDERTVAIPVGHSTRYADIYEIIGKDSITVRQEGKNLLDTTHMQNGNYNKYNIPNNLMPNTTYTYTIKNSTKSFGLFMAKDASETGNGTSRLASYISNSSLTFTTPNDMSEYPYLLLGVSSAGAGATNPDFQVEYGSSSTDIVPYIAPVEYTVDFDSTVYGSTVDVINGDSKITWVAKNLSELTGDWSSDPISGDYIRFSQNVPDKEYGYRLMCDKFSVSSNIIPVLPSSEAISGYSANNAVYIGILVSRLSGDMSTPTGRSNAFKAYLQENDIQIAYPLATPSDFDTEPNDVRLFKGYNRVSNDGEITMEYCQDIGRILKQLINYPSLPTSDGYYRLHVSHNGDELIYDWSTAQ